MKKKQIKQLEKVVKEILEKDTRARDCDNRLILDVMQVYVGEQIYYSPFASILNNANVLGVPPFESITRCRRKVQEKYPELQASDKIDRYRYENEMTMKEVMRNGEEKTIIEVG